MKSKLIQPPLSVSRMLARVCLRRSLSAFSGKRALSAAAAPVPAPAQDEEDGLIGVSENVRSIADQICNLSLMETGHLTKVLKSRLGELNVSDYRTPVGRCFL